MANHPYQSTVFTWWTLLETVFFTKYLPYPFFNIYYHVVTPIITYIGVHGCHFCVLLRWLSSYRPPCVLWEVPAAAVCRKCLSPASWVFVSQSLLSNCLYVTLLAYVFAIHHIIQNWSSRTIEHCCLFQPWLPQGSFKKIYWWPGWVTPAPKKGSEPVPQNSRQSYMKSQHRHCALNSRGTMAFSSHFCF